MKWWWYLIELKCVKVHPFSITIWSDSNGKMAHHIENWDKRNWGCVTHQTMGQNSMKMKILNFFSELWGKLPERFTESFLEFTFCYLELTLILNKLPFLDRDLTKMWNTPLYLLIIIFLVTYCHSFYCPYQHRHLGRNIFQLHGPSGASHLEHHEELHQGTQEPATLPEPSFWTAEKVDRFAGTEINSCSHFYRCFFSLETRLSWD